LLPDAISRVRVYVVNGGFDLGEWAATGARATGLVEVEIHGEAGERKGNAGGGTIPRRRDQPDEAPVGALGPFEIGEECCAHAVVVVFRISVRRKAGEVELGGIE
jgi:hypothetical protein